MKITAGLLKELGFERQKNINKIEIDEWYMKMHGYLFIVKGGPPNWRYFPPGAIVLGVGGGPYSHSVSDIEELLAFTYEDGYESGKEANKQELREFLGVKG